VLWSIGVTDRLQLFSESLALLAVLMLQSGLLAVSLAQSLGQCVHLRLHLLHISLQLRHLALPLSLTDVQLAPQLVSALLELLRTQQPEVQSLQLHCILIWDITLTLYKNNTA